MSRSRASFMLVTQQRVAYEHHNRRGHSNVQISWTCAPRLVLQDHQICMQLTLQSTCAVEARVCTMRLTPALVLQEYLGSYVADTHGRLVFQEGALVRAARSGTWVILDELNLAPTEVLEALNRLLDDNRELFIPETQETVTPHPAFMLFGTQNPPGAYAGALYSCIRASMARSRQGYGMPHFAQWSSVLRHELTRGGISNVCFWTAAATRAAAFRQARADRLPHLECSGWKLSAPACLWLASVGQADC